MSFLFLVIARVAIPRLNQNKLEETLSMENSILLKGLKRPNTKSSKIAGVSRMFFA